MPSTAKYRPVQPSTAQYSPVKPSTAQYIPLQPSTTKYSPVQPNTAQCSLVHPSTAQYSPVQHSTAQYSPVQHSAVHYSPTPPVQVKVYHNVYISTLSRQSFVQKHSGLVIVLFPKTLIDFQNRFCIWFEVSNVHMEVLHCFTLLTLHTMLTLLRQ